MSRVRIISLSCTCLLLAVFISSVSADVILKKDGTVLECLIKSETKDTYHVWVVTESGDDAEYPVPKDEVKGIEKRSYWGSEYKKLFSSTNFDNEGSVKVLAEWCEEHNLRALAKKYSARAAELHNKDIIKEYPEVACEPCSAEGSLKCKACEGKGYTLQKCDKCKGAGRIKCATCKGEGWIKCDKCGGKGEITVKKTGGGGGSKSKQQQCSKCRGKGKVRCRECHSKGNIKCSDCRGSGTKKVVCKECGGKPVTRCEACEGTGIDPVKYKALQERLEREKTPPPVVVKPNETEESPEEIARKKLLARTMFINSYMKTRDGEITNEYLKDKIFLYPSLPVARGEWPVLTDNTKVLLVEGDAEPQDGGDGRMYYHIELEGDGDSKIVGYVAEKYLRKMKFEFVDCTPCEMKGSFKCPACEGGGKINVGKKKSLGCKVCRGKGRIICKHCLGSGKLRKQ
ncbi:MAG: DnaJ-like cysteine-rich domain-containing protein [Planctomycetota bacterium]